MKPKEEKKGDILVWRQVLQQRNVVWCKSKSTIFSRDLVEAAYLYWRPAGRKLEEVVSRQYWETSTKTNERLLALVPMCSAL